jgi:hypothetical protein
MVELIPVRYGGSPVLSALLAEELLHSVFRRVRKIAKNGYQRRHICLSVRPSACNKSAFTRLIFIKLDILELFENPLRKFKFNYNIIIIIIIIIVKISGTLHEDLFTFIILSR